MIEVISPSTQELVGRAPLGNSADIYAAVAAARKAFDEGPWPKMSIEERRAVVRRAGEILAAQTDDLSRLITHENGTLFKLRLGNNKAIVDYYCGLDIRSPLERTSFTGARARIVKEPIGVVGAIIPWNAPLRLALYKIVPAMLTGCTTVLKPAPETPLDAYVVAQAFADAGLPPGVLNIVAADRDVSETLVRHPGVDVISFTGSTAAGKTIGAICGAKVQRAHLELGGKSAAIILEDAEIGEAIPKAISGGMLLNNGQACAAWTRILVPESRHDEMVEAMCDYLRTVKMGDPFDERMDIGPLAARRQRDRVESYIELAQREGAKVAVGGGRPKGLDRGWYVEPTLLVNATNDMRSSREEIFGPVGSVIRYRSVDEAIQIANDSNYGLSGAIFTADAERGVELAGRIRAGTVGINSIGIDPAFPFGGYKDSGVGRQCGPESLEEYLETKTIALPGSSFLDHRK